MKNLSKTFLKPAGRKQPTEVCTLKNVNFNVKENEFVTIIGPSGCGKTTLLRIIDGLIPWDEGEVLVNGKRVVGSGTDRGFVFQHFGLLPWRNVRNNLAFGLELQGGMDEAKIKIVKDLIDLVGLSGFEEHYPHELSGGMRQRVGLARALAINPDILLMDEPFGSLDAQTREFLERELLRIWSKTKKTVIYVTHSVDEAIFLSDRIVVLTARPGTVKEIIDVSLPRPREEFDDRFVAQSAKIKLHLWESLKEETSFAKE